MGKSKKYVYDYEQFENGKGPGTMVEDILNDPEFSQVSDLVIGCWGESWDDNCQIILDQIVENKERFFHV